MVSIRAACGTIGFYRSTFHDTSRRTDQVAVAKRIRDTCEMRVRYGSRRVHVLPGHEDWGINIKKFWLSEPYPTWAIRRNISLSATSSL